MEFKKTGPLYCAALSNAGDLHVVRLDLLWFFSTYRQVVGLVLILIMFGFEFLYLAKSRLDFIVQMFCANDYLFSLFPCKVTRLFIG